MYIRKLKIRNIRGFKEVDLDFTRPDGSLAGWTVLAGRNGSGKSSFLKLLAATYPSFQINPHDWRRQGTKRGKAELELAAGRRKPERTLTIAGDVVSVEGLPDLGTDGFFMVGYGPYRRLSASALDDHYLPPSLARFSTLFQEDSSLLESVAWLREVYLRRLERKKGAAGLEQAILALLSDGLLPDGVTIEKIDSDGLWVRQHRALLPLMALSDGYRTTAALVMDIVRHLYQFFGDLKVESFGEKSRRVLHEGVVLIDEVDLHLHVSWQRRIGFWLKSRFPNIQFIVTTHSPFVCQAADPKGLIRLPAPGEDRSAEHVSEELYNTVVNGSLDEAVLTELFGLETPYSEPAEKLRERVAHLEARLQTGKGTKAEKREYQELSARLPQTPVTAVEQALRKLAADA